MDPLGRLSGKVAPLGGGTTGIGAAAAPFLASDDGSAVTGIDLPVDGGWLEPGRPIP